jgi:hypothetical protein
MISYKMHGLFAAIVLLTFRADLAWSQQKLDEAGTDTLISDNTVSELDKGHLVILVNEKGIEIADDSSMPTHMSTIDCQGMVEVFPSEAYKGNGYCTVTDRQGDKLFQRWNVGSESSENFYENVGGTGKFEGAKGQGTTTEIEISQGPQGRHVVRWKGSTEYPKLGK